MHLREVELGDLHALASEWDALAAQAASPFLTTAWLTCWGRAFATRDTRALVLESDGRLLAGGCFVDDRRGGLASAANSHSNDWDIVALDDEARGHFWEALAVLRLRRLTAALLPDGGVAAAATLRALKGAHYRTAEQALPPSPWMELPSSLDELLRARSRNLRSQVGRRRRALEREGSVTLRTTMGGPALEPDLESFLAVEASGWKGASGTAITASASTETMYRSFAEVAARLGWLRLYLLELDGEPIAADYGCAFAGCGYLIKTGFREDFGHLAPGLVLRAEVVRASMEEGLWAYDFLGGPDPYKLRWTDELRGRATIRAFRGVRSAPSFLWWRGVRPALKAGHDRVRRLRGHAVEGP